MSGDGAIQFRYGFDDLPIRSGFVEDDQIRVWFPDSALPLRNEKCAGNRPNLSGTSIGSQDPNPPPHSPGFTISPNVPSRAARTRRGSPERGVRPDLAKNSSI